MLLRDQVGDLIAPGVHDLAEGEEDICAIGERRRPPSSEGFLSYGDGLVDLCDARQGDLTLLLAGRGIEDRPGVAGCPGHALSVDPVVDRVHVLLRSSSVWMNRFR